MLDLESIFGLDAPARATMPLVVAKPAGQEPMAEAEPMVRDRPAAEALAPVEVAAKPAEVASATGDVLSEVESAECIERPDASGRMGWEPPDLAEWQRWWAHSMFEDLPEPPPPCSKCGSLELWETTAGTWRCVHCDPPAAASRLLEQAAAIRRHHGKPDSPGAAEMLADLKCLTDTG
jgi:hypothetical protein